MSPKDIVNEIKLGFQDHRYPKDELQEIVDIVKKYEHNPRDTFNDQVYIELLKSALNDVVGCLYSFPTAMYDFFESNFVDAVADGAESLLADIEFGEE